MNTNNDKCLLKLDYSSKLNNWPNKFVADRRDETSPIFSGKFDVLTQSGVESVYIKRVLYNNPVVVVWWSDNTTTKAKVKGDDKYSPEIGLMYCIMKKIAPNCHFDDIIDEWTPSQIPMEYKMQYVDIKDVRARHKSR